MREQRVSMLALVLVWSFATSAAAADDNGLVLVRGDAGEGRRAAVGAAIETAARAAGWLLPAKPLGKKAADAILTCADTKTPWTCMPSAPGAAGIRQLFVIGVQDGQSDTGAPLVVINAKLIIPHTQTVVVRQRFCEQCADNRLVEASTELVQQILRSIAVRAGHTTVVIKSNPAGAEIELDGTPMGVTEASYGTYPGKHVVVLRMDGYVPETRELVVEEGKTAELAVELRSVHPATTIPPVEPRPRSRRLPTVALASGALLLSFSGYAFYRDAHGHDKFTYEHATTAGIVSGILGLGAIGTGVYLLLREPDASAPVVNVGSSAAVAGWAWRF